MRENRHRIMAESLVSLLQDQVNNALKFDNQKNSGRHQVMIKVSA